MIVPVISNRHSEDLSKAHANVVEIRAGRLTETSSWIDRPIIIIKFDFVTE